MALTFRFAVHLSAFALEAFIFYYDYFIIEIGHQGFGGKFKFLTLWCLTLQTIYFGLSAILDLIEKVQNPSHANQRSGLQKFRDGFHATVIFPVSIFVAATFWTLYAIDRDLVYPKKLDAIIPVWLNHCLHTTIVPLVIIDKMVTLHFYPRRLNGILACSALALIYLFWILLVAYVDNFWVYPILKVLQVHERVLFIGLCLVVISAFYILGEYVTKQQMTKSPPVCKVCLFCLYVRSRRCRNSLVHKRLHAETQQHLVHASKRRA